MYKIFYPLVVCVMLMTFYRPVQAQSTANMERFIDIEHHFSFVYDKQHVMESSANPFRLIVNASAEENIASITIQVEQAHERSLSDYVADLGQDAGFRNSNLKQLQIDAANELAEVMDMESADEQLDGELVTYRENMSREQTTIFVRNEMPETSEFLLWSRGFIYRIELDVLSQEHMETALTAWSLFLNTFAVVDAADGSIVGEQPIRNFQSNVAAISSEETTIPVAWSMNDRPENTNLVFEQILPVFSVQNAELPREVEYVSSEDVGVVTVEQPEGVDYVLLQMSLVDLSTDQVLDSRIIYVPIQEAQTANLPSDNPSNPDQTEQMDNTPAPVPPPPPQEGTRSTNDGEIVIEGVVTDHVQNCALDGYCYVVVQTDGGSFYNVVYIPGNFPCPNPNLANNLWELTVGDRVEAYGELENDSAMGYEVIQVCPRDDYYLNTVTN